MVDDGLEALRQGYEASLRQLQTLLDAQARLRETAEQLATETRRQLERLAEALCPQLVDVLCKKDPLGFAGMAPQALAEAVVRDVQRRLSCAGAAELAGQSVEELYETALEELAQLREGNARLEDELAQVRRQAREAELHAAVVRRSLEGTCAEAVPSPAGQPAAPLPDWVRAWQEQETHAHDLALLRVLAETGVARRERAVRLLGERLGVAPSSGDVVEAFRRCRERLGLIEDVGEGEGDRPSPLLRLAPRGADACRLLLAREPAPGLATGLLARHGSTARVLLCLEAADVLREAGYQVDVLPEPLPLPDGRPFTPHLAAVLDGGVLLAEIVDEPREQANRWQDCADAAGGRLYVAVPDRATLERVKSDILFRAGQPLALWMMALDEARGKRGDDVWIFRRDITPT